MVPTGNCLLNQITVEFNVPPDREYVYSNVIPPPNRPQRITKDGPKRFSVSTLTIQRE